MNKSKLYTSIALLAGVCTISACSDEKKETTATQETTPTETVDPIAERIKELEALSEDLVNEIERVGNRWSYAHPDVPDDEAIDSLNAITADLRMESKALHHEIDSLKAL